MKMWSPGNKAKTIISCKHALLLLGLSAAVFQLAGYGCCQTSIFNGFKTAMKQVVNVAENAVSECYSSEKNSDTCACWEKINYQAHIQYAGGYAYRCLTPICQGFSGLFVLLSLLSWSYFLVRRRNFIKLREKFFRENGGLVLQQQNPLRQSTVEAIKIFTVKELEKATENYSENRIIGQGGNGTVYQGVLQDRRIIAVKKSEKVDKAQTQMEQFNDEVVVLTRNNHRNVVKFLGFCLEAQVPLLVYEFVPNGKPLIPHAKRSSFSQIS